MSTVHTFVTSMSSICIEKNDEYDDTINELETLTCESRDDLECAEIVLNHEMKYKKRVSNPKNKDVAVKSSRSSKRKVLRLESFLTSDRRRSLAAEITRRAQIYKKVIVFTTVSINYCLFKFIYKLFTEI